MTSQAILHNSTHPLRIASNEITERIYLKMFEMIVRELGLEVTYVTVPIETDFTQVLMDVGTGVYAAYIGDAVISPVRARIVNFRSS